MLRTRLWGILLTFVGAITVWAGQLQFTNTPLDTASLPRITESEVGQKSDKRPFRSGSRSRTIS